MQFQKNDPRSEFCDGTCKHRFVPLGDLNLLFNGSSFFPLPSHGTKSRQTLPSIGRYRGIVQATTAALITGISRAYTYILQALGPKFQNRHIT